MRAAIATAFLVAGCSSETADFDVAKGASFRYFARDVVSSLDPVCPMTKRPELLAKYEPVRSRFDALKGKVSGSQLATDLAIVEADEKYVRSITVVECIGPDGPDTERYFSNNIGTMLDRLDKMEAIAKQQGIL